MSANIKSTSDNSEEQLEKLTQTTAELKKQIVRLQKEVVSLQAKYDAEVIKTQVYRKREKDRKEVFNMVSDDTHMDSMLAHLALQQAAKFGGWSKYEAVAIRQAQNYNPVDDELE